MRLADGGMKQEMAAARAEDKSDPRLRADAMTRLMGELYPICRSITGDGVRKTLRILQRDIPLTIHEVPSGTRVLDWTVPREWNIHAAFIRDAAGRKIVDFEKSNLHVVNYSVPFRGRLSREELKKHLFSIPENPDWIPYRTTYYQANWGFCVSHRQLMELEEGEYDVVIDSSLEDGALTYGEYYLAGRSPQEVLLSCHVCHPSLCNDNLSGIAVMAALADHVRRMERRYSYRFLFIPGTIGSITWLALNERQISLIKHGIVLAGVGDRGGFTYKRSRRGDAEVDRVFAYVLRRNGGRTVDFFPYGYDERQYCSPGFNLPVGCVMRTPFGEYAEYHTSADDLSFVDRDSLLDSLEKCIAALRIIERNETCVNLNPRGEPQLGRRGLYDPVGEQTPPCDRMALRWVLNLSDGSHTLLDIAERSGCDFDALNAAAELLVTKGLLRMSAE
jgi:aminopeptidase-like protein